MNTVFRFLFFLLNTFLVLLALITVGGRVLMHQADDLEDEINNLLARSGVGLRGLEGGWHGLDPVVRIAEVDFPGGRAEVVRLELDLVESLLRGTLVAHHLAVARLEVTPVRTLDGRWTLGRSAGAAAPTLDPLPMLEHSDRLELPEVRLRIAREAPDAIEDPLELLGELKIAARVDNALQRHVGRVRLALADDSCADCAIEVRWDLTGVLAGLDRNGAIVVDGDGFRLPAPLGRALGVGGATFERLAGRWTVADGYGRGRLEAVLREIALPAGALDAMELDVRGEAARGFETEIRLAVPVLAVRAHDGAVTSIEGVRGSLTGDGLEWSVPVLDIATQVPLVHAAFSNMRWSNEWLPALNPRGRIERLSGRFSFDSRRLAVAADVLDVSLEHYKGSPYVRNGRAAVIGSERGFELRIDGDAMTLGLLDVYPTPTTFDRLTGRVHIWFKGRFLQLRGEELIARLGPTTARGTFGVSRPQDPLQQRVSLAIGADLLDVLTAKQFVPQKLPDGVRGWIDRAVVSGTARNAAVTFHGYLRSLGDLPVRQTELRFDVEDGAVRFHDDWPLAAALDGAVVVAADGVRATLSNGTLRGVELDGASVEAAKGENTVHFVGNGVADGTTLMHLIADSPLREPLAFVRPDWRFSGPLDYRIDLTVPIGRVVRDRSTSGPPTGSGTDGALAIALSTDLRGVTANLGNVGLVIGDVRGRVEYRYPFDVSAAGLNGRMLGAPATFGADTERGRVRLGFAGAASVAALEDWLSVTVQPEVSGKLGFAGTLDAWPGRDRPIEIEVRTDLTGVAVALPAPFAKPAETARPTTLAIVPDAGALTVRAAIADAGAGWLRIPEDAAMAATFEVGAAAPPAVDVDQDALALTGTIASTDLGAWLALLPRGRGGSGTMRPLEIRALRIDALRARDVVLDDLTLDAALRDGTANVRVAADAIDGSLVIPAEGPWRLALAHLRLPSSEEPTDADPLAGFDMSVVDAVDVEIGDASVGGRSYGTWRFSLRRDGDEVRLEGLVGDLRGLRIEGSEPLRWRWRDGGDTRLVADITTGDVGDVLTEFGYARSVETKSARAQVDFHWSGSPLNFALAGLSGEVDTRAEEGRFLEVDSGSGPLRVFSLLNFTAIAKRIALDFSDVFGKGVSFEVLTARLGIERRRISFVEPMVIDGTGGYFRVSGRVDLATGALDNEMIVTLPVNKSLPWYAAYLGFVNPLAAGAVLVGERIFRNQIQQFSSATYKVKGTLEDPKVEFVGIFGRPATTGETPAAVESPKPAVPLEAAPPKTDQAEPS